MKLTHLTSRGGVVLACAVAVVVAGANGRLGAGPRSTRGSQRAALCPSGGALVTYATTGATARTIVVQHDGRVWLCWNGAKGDVARAGFVLSKADLTALRADLRKISVRHLAPCDYCDPLVASLTLRGTSLSWAAQQPTSAGAVALIRAELMLDVRAEQRIAGL